jgi:DNA mismatch repair protein MutS
MNFSMPATKPVKVDSPVEKRLKAIEPDELTARQALDLLYELKSTLD